MIRYWLCGVQQWVKRYTWAKYDGIPEHDVVRAWTARYATWRIGREPLEVADKPSLAVCRLEQIKSMEEFDANGEEICLPSFGVGRTMIARARKCGEGLITSICPCLVRNGCSWPLVSVGLFRRAASSDVVQLLPFTPPSVPSPRNWRAANPLFLSLPKKSRFSMSRQSFMPSYSLVYLPSLTSEKSNVTDLRI